MDRLLLILEDRVVPLEPSSEWRNIAWQRASLRIRVDQDLPSHKAISPIFVTRDQLESPGEFAIPFTSAIRLDLDLPADSLDVSAKITVLDQDWLQAFEQGQLDRGEERFLPLDSVQHLLSRYRKTFGAPATPWEKDYSGPPHWTDLDPQEDATYHASIEGGGKALLMVHSRGCGLRYAWIELMAGEETKTRMRLTMRPLLIGRLTDEDDNPVPDAEVEAFVSLGSHWAETDLTGKLDAGGLAVGGEPGNYFRSISLLSRTDGAGRFQIRVPRGETYAVQAKRGASYAFLTQEAPVNELEGEVVEFDLKLISARTKEGVRVQVLDPDRRPAAGLFLELLPVSDRPWYRMFPSVQIDEEGWARFPWLDEGAFVILQIHRTADRWAGKVLHTLDYIHLPPNSDPLVVILPERPEEERQ